MKTDDICKGRHRGNEQSVAANERAQPKKQPMREQILSLFDSVKYLTLANIAVALGKEKNAVSGRVTELVKAGLLERTGEIYKGYAVYRRV